MLAADAAAAFARGSVLGERGFPRFLLERDLVAVALGFDFELRRLVPTGTGQAAVVEDHAERVVAQRNDLRAELKAGLGWGEAKQRLVAQIDSELRFRKLYLDGLLAISRKESPHTIETRLTGDVRGRAAESLA